MPGQNLYSSARLQERRKKVNKLSLQWRITIMTTLLIGITCVLMKVLLCSSGIHYMDAIGNSVIDSAPIASDSPGFFDPNTISDKRGLSIVISNAQEEFCMTNWYITAIVTIVSGILAWFVSGRALRPLRKFTNQVETVQLHNIAEIRINENTVPEFRQLGQSFNAMLERLNNAFSAQKQFTGNAAHELRTPVALMQAQVELFEAEHPDIPKEYREFTTQIKEQTERLTQTIKTLLDMSSMQSVARNDVVQIAPLVEEIFADLSPEASKKDIAFSLEGDAEIKGSDTLIYRMIYNLCENAIKFNRPNGGVFVRVIEDETLKAKTDSMREYKKSNQRLTIEVEDCGFGIPKEFQRSIFQPFFRVDKSRSRENGGVGLGMSLVWEIVSLHGGRVFVKESDENGTTIAVELPV